MSEHDQLVMLFHIVNTERLVMLATVTSLPRSRGDDRRRLLSDAQKLEGMLEDIYARLTKGGDVNAGV